MRQIPHRLLFHAKLLRWYSSCMGFSKVLFHSGLVILEQLAILEKSCFLFLKSSFRHGSVVEYEWWELSPGQCYLVMSTFQFQWLFHDHELSYIHPLLTCKVRIQCSLKSFLSPRIFPIATGGHIGFLSWLHLIRWNWHLGGVLRLCYSSLGPWASSQGVLLWHTVLLCCHAFLLIARVPLEHLCEDGREASELFFSSCLRC